MFNSNVPYAAMLSASIDQYWPWTSSEVRVTSVTSPRTIFSVNFLRGFSCPHRRLVNKNLVESNFHPMEGQWLDFVSHFCLKSSKCYFVRHSGELKWESCESVHESVSNNQFLCRTVKATEKRGVVLWVTLSIFGEQEFKFACWFWVHQIYLDGEPSIIGLTLDLSSQTKAGQPRLPNRGDTTVKHTALIRTVCPENVGWSLDVRHPTINMNQHQPASITNHNYSTLANQQ